MVRSKKPLLGHTMKNKKPITFRKKLDNPVFKKLALAFVIVIIATATYLQYLAPHTLEAKQRVELESTQTQLIETKRTLEQQKTLDAQQDAEKQKQIEEVQKKLEETEKQLQAKRSTPQSSVAYAAEAPASTPQRTYTGGGNKEVWMAAAGIPQSDWWAVDSIVSRESGWNPCAYNPSRSDCNATPTTACGLAQALPCSKVGPNWNDPVVSLKWQYQYVTARYGGYPQAVAFWNANHWY